MGGLGGVILAAGASSRMGRDKALLPWPPQSQGPSAARPTILSASIEALSQHCELVVVVAGTNEPELRPVVYACGAVLIQNLDPERGQFSSLQTGLQEILNRGRDSAVIALVDRPPALPETLQNIVDAFLRRPRGIWAVVPEYRGAHGHPIVIGREMIESFLKAPPGSSAREIEHANQSRISYLPTDDPSVTRNIDTPQDYASLQSST